MPACVENMFYVSNEGNGRFKPWHGLGTEVADAPTSLDALHLAGLDWDVVPEPVYLENGIVIPNYVANTRNTDKKVLGIVTDRYKVVQNKDAFAFTDSLVGNGDVRYETAGSLLGGKKIWLLAKMPTEKILDDDVDPYICFVNSHDGTGAIRVCMTPVRVVCNNTLNLALSTTTRAWSTKHIGDIEGKLAEARETLGMARAYMDGLNEEADKLANTTIKDDEVAKILEEIFPIDDADTDRKRNNMIDAREYFNFCYNQPDIKKFYGTLWGVVNAASDMAGHMEPARNTNSYRENNWGRIINGHAILDNVYKRVAVA